MRLDLEMLGQSWALVLLLLPLRPCKRALQPQVRDPLLRQPWGERGSLLQDQPEAEELELEPEQAEELELELELEPEQADLDLEPELEAAVVPEEEEEEEEEAVDSRRC